MEPNQNNHSPVLDIKEILKILPHRYPFLLVDKIVSIDLEANTIVGQKNVTMNEQFFQGHFPEAPIMPGVLILEALAQTGGILIHQKGCKDKIAVFLNVSQAKFRNPVKPGDILYLHAEGIHFSSRAGKIKAVARVNDKIAAEAEIAFALVYKSQI
jgi:3-hydroxyacyl-[acyl-carrier-protein] dehydratase